MCLLLLSFLEIRCEEMSWLEVQESLHSKLTLQSRIRKKGLETTGTEWAACKGWRGFGLWVRTQAWTVFRLHQTGSLTSHPQNPVSSWLKKTWPQGTGGKSLGTNRAKTRTWSGNDHRKQEWGSESRPEAGLQHRDYCSAFQMVLSPKRRIKVVVRDQESSLHFSLEAPLSHLQRHLHHWVLTVPNPHLGPPFPSAY